MKEWLKTSLVLLAVLIPGSAWAISFKPVYNPATGKQDMIASISTGTFIPNTGVGGLFTVNSASPTTVTNGEISVSYVGGPAVWAWINGDRYRFSLISDPVGPSVDEYLLVQDNSFFLLEDSSKVILE